MKRNAFKGLICFLMAFSAATLFAQNATLDSVCESLTKNTVTTGNFTQEKKLPSVKRALKSYGTFVFCKDGIVWNTTRPVKSSLAVTSTKLVQFTPDGKQTVLDGADNAIFKSIAQTVTALFSGDKAALEKNFTVSFSSTANTWTMSLTPKDKTIAAVMKIITLSGSGNAASSSFDSLAVEQQDGSSVTYTFTEQQYKEVLSNEEKAFFAAK